MTDAPDKICREARFLAALDMMLETGAPPSRDQVKDLFADDTDMGSEVLRLMDEAGMDGGDEKSASPAVVAPSPFPAIQTPSEPASVPSDWLVSPRRHVRHQIRGGD